MGSVVLQFRRILGHIGGGQVIGNRSFQEVEPEQRKLGEHPSLLGNAGCQHIVERRNAIGGNEQQVIGIDVVDIADLAAGMKLKFRKIGLKKNAADS